jgi:hypothetical protein
VVKVFLDDRLRFCNVRVRDYSGELEGSSLSVTEANFLLDTFSPNAMLKGGYELISCLDRFGVSFLAELGLQLIWRN